MESHISFYSSGPAILSGFHDILEKTLIEYTTVIIYVNVIGQHLDQSTVLTFETIYVHYGCNAQVVLKIYSGAVCKI